MPFADVGLLKVPDGLTDEQVLFLSDILPTGWQGAVQCDIQPTDTVAIWGCGPVGQMAIRSAILLGAKQVVVIDRVPERLAMAKAGWGRIVNITSRAALGKAERTAYVAAKAGLIGLTRVWALEYAAAGITVNAVGPGPIETPLFAGANSRPSDGTDLAESVPVKRMGKPSEVAHAVNFFASEEAGFVTGQTLYVCGGMTVGANHF